MRKPDPEKIGRRLVPVVKRMIDVGEEALQRARDSLSPLRAHTYGPGRAPVGSINDTTGQTACARADKGGVDPFVELAQAMLQLEAAGAKVEYLIERQFGSKRPQRQAGSGPCVACDETVNGKGGERLRSGLCPRCYAAFHRAKQRTGIDRSTWLARTRKGGRPKSENPPDEVSTPKGGRPKSENPSDEFSTPKGGRPKSENP